MLKYHGELTFLSQNFVNDLIVLSEEMDSEEEGEGWAVSNKEESVRLITYFEEKLVLESSEHNELNEHCIYNSDEIIDIGGKPHVAPFNIHLRPEVVFSVLFCCISFWLFGKSFPKQLRFCSMRTANYAKFCGDIRATSYNYEMNCLHNHFRRKRFNNCS